MARRAVILAVAALAAAISLAMVAGVSGQHDSPPNPGTESGVAQVRTPTPTATPVVTPPPDPGPKVVEEKSEPLITGDRVFWLVMASLLAAWSILLGLLGLFWWAMRWEEGQTSGLERLGRPAIEGITLVMVVVAVIILGIQAVIGDQGVVAILSAIVGYTLGRAAGRGQPDGNGGTRETGGGGEAGGGGAATPSPGEGG
jgi:uncharacterized membrane protein YgcG